MTSILVSELPAGQTLEMPCNNLLTTNFQTATTASVGGGSITRLLRVDATLGSASGDGSLGQPFATVQQAVTNAVSRGWNNVQICVAAGTYPGAVVVPISLATIISGYDETGIDSPVLGGAFSFTGAGEGTLGFVDCQVSAPTIDAGIQDLYLIAWRSVITSAVTGANLTCEWHDTIQSGNVTAAAILTTFFDGPAWAKTIDVNPAFLAGVAYGRTFSDAGHDVVTANVFLNGLAIGSSAFVNVPLPTFVRADDRVQLQVDDPTVVDFTVSLHGVVANTAVVYLTNLSRVSTNFDEPCLFTVHHNTMFTEPAGP